MFFVKWLLVFSNFCFELNQFLLCRCLPLSLCFLLDLGYLISDHLGVPCSWAPWENHVVHLKLLSLLLFTLGATLPRKPPSQTLQLRHCRGQLDLKCRCRPVGYWFSLKLCLARSGKLAPLSLLQEVGVSESCACFNDLIICTGRV